MAARYEFHNCWGYPVTFAHIHNLASLQAASPSNIADEIGRIDLCCTKYHPMPLLVSMSNYPYLVPFCEPLTLFHILPPVLGILVMRLDFVRVASDFPMRLIDSVKGCLTTRPDLVFLTAWNDESISNHPRYPDRISDTLGTWFHSDLHYVIEDTSGLRCETRT
jgi:hypothetical protein